MAQWTVDAKLALLRQHDEGVPWTRLAATAGVPVRTLSRWAKQYRTHSTSAGLERRARADKGRQRTSAELVEAIQALALRRPEPTAAFIHRRVSGLAQDRGVPAPSYSTVRAVIAAIDPGLRTLAQHGDAAYRDRFELVYRRTADAPNDQWQADHTLLDVMILDAKQQPARPWLTVVLDDYSRAAAGYTPFLGAPTAEQTALALHQAVRPKTNPAWPVQGLPNILYSDHGSDFTSVRLEQVCLDTHIQLIHSRVGVPQGRGKIERFFRTITTELLPHLPGYIPHANGGTPITPPALTLEQLDAAIETFIVGTYHLRVHAETGAAPAARWSDGGWIPRLPAHPDDLDLLLLNPAAGRRVQRDGVRFNGTRYVSPVLAAFVGENVTVRYDPRDAGEIRIYHHDAFLCRAVAPELAGETFTLKQVQAARTARRRALREQLHQRRSLVDALPVDTRWTPAADTAADNNTSGADLASPAISEQTPAGEAPAPTGKTKGLRMYATD